LKATGRRIEFLKALSAIAAESGAPVHYGEVADRMGVSKWTAYDMMRQLMADNLVRASYSTSASAFRGRSQVLFEPTATGIDVLREAGTVATLSAKHWQEELASILSKVIAALESKTDLETALSDFEDASPLVHCVALLGFLIVEFKRRGLSLRTLEAIIGAGVEAGTTLFILIGILAGELLVKGAARVMHDMDAQIQKFSEEISRMGDNGRRLLAEFARTVVIKASAT
jgi:energy-coupling factor transport system substrate-specific component